MLNSTRGEGRDVDRCSNLKINFLTLQLLALSFPLLNSLYTLLHASIDLSLIATYSCAILFYAEIGSYSLVIELEPAHKIQ